MRASTFFLTASLAVNAALVAVLLVGATQRNASDANSHAAITAAPAESAGAARTSAAPKPAVDPETWSQLENVDLRTMMDQLRAAGLPLDLVRAIMAEAVRVQFAPRRAASNARYKEPPYWNPGAVDPKQQAEMREIMRAQEKALRDLLGAEADPADPYFANLHRQFPNWPDEKFAALAQIRSDYVRKQQELYANVRGSLSPDDQRQLAAIERAQRDAIAQALSPQEFEEYQLRTSSTAQNLRSQLAAFDTTEQEFRSLFKLQSAFDDQYGRLYTVPTREEMQARSNAQRQLTEDVHAALGDARFADYQRATDYNFRQTSALVERLELPPDTALQLYNAQKQFEQQRNDLMRGANRDTIQAAVQQVNALQQEAVARVTPLLGSARAVEAYKTNGGQWLQPINVRVGQPASAPVAIPAAPGGAAASPPPPPRN
jgi:hypothetical protein